MKVKKILTLVLIFLLIFMPIVSFADFGDFESYDSGSSWDSDYSWSSSDYGSSWSDSDYSGSNYSFIPIFGSSGTTVIIIIIILAVIIISKNSNKNRPLHNVTNVTNYKPVATNGEIEAKVKAVDDLFNAEEFIAWVKDVFVKLQKAWMDKDYNIIRHFETIQMFEQTKEQIQSYIDNHKTNKLERICVKEANLEEFKQSGDKDILTVILSSKMIDYIINDDTKEILKGDTTTDRHSTYKMTFIRKTGVKTKEGTDNIVTTNCPNCGAPTEVTSSGKCKYCDSVITTGEFGWVLSSIEKLY